MRHRFWILTVPLAVHAVLAIHVSAQDAMIDQRLFHLRSEEPPEWSDFPAMPDAKYLHLTFDATQNTTEQTLSMRQCDVKQTWNVVLNTKQLGRLTNDENDMVVYFPIPPGALVDGPNELRIEHDDRRRRGSDDIRVGQITLHRGPRSEVLSECSIGIRVRDSSSGELTPCRLTITRADGAMQTTSAQYSDPPISDLAIRPGTIYTSTGVARFGLPAGDYRFHAGRGFEYSLDTTTVTLQTGDAIQKVMKIRREVPTDGFVACDTHVHSLTHSGHGDATVQERMITLAGEGVELPIATDHNVHIDHNSFARSMGVRNYFTPVIGNEVTTRVGHFNVWPVTKNARVPDASLERWSDIFAEVFRTPGVRVAILNHARDVHGGTRPFGPKLHNAIVGENMAGWPMQFNAMEVINSGATQTDPLRLLRDWMALLNRGFFVTPVGSSDSHDVSRHFVGQGRTYIRCRDIDPAAIDVSEAADNFLQGQVMVSYGLLAELTVDGKYSCGDVAPTTSDEVHMAVRVLGPHWVNASKVLLFVNGERRIVAPIESEDRDNFPPGVIWKGEWKILAPKHDVHLVAVAIGPGIDGPFWKTAKPYQPTSPAFTAQILGCSGAVWIDADHDGRRTAAYDYAQRLVLAAGNDLRQLVERLAGYDESVAIQALHLLFKAGHSPVSSSVHDAFHDAAPATQRGLQNYIRAWRECEQARSEQ